MPDSGGIMQLKKEYDVFIAYHGSYEADGSARTADRIYSYLTGKGIKCFYFPRSAKDAYKANIIEVMKSRLFLFVCSTGVHTDDSKRLDPKRHYELSTEIDAFYALTQLGDAAVKDAKIYACGDMRKGDEACLHELFSNRTHFYESGDEANDFAMIYDWAAHRLENAVSWNETQITSEIKEVFATRASMNQSCRFDDLVATAKCVRAVGISNSELTARINPSAIRNCIARGGKIEILFLDPDGTYTSLREKEEDLRANRIKNITNVNIETALDIRDSLGDGRSNMTIYTYDKQPRMNMIFVDDYLILQYYSNNVQGINNPSFFIEKQAESPVYEFCEKSYNYLKSEAKPMEI